MLCDETAELFRDFVILLTTIPEQAIPLCRIANEILISRKPPKALTVSTHSTLQTAPARTGRPGRAAASQIDAACAGHSLPVEHTRALGPAVDVWRYHHRVTELNDSGGPGRLAPRCISMWRAAGCWGSPGIA